MAKSPENGSNSENYSKIATFLNTLEDTNLIVKPTWTKEEAALVIKLSFDVAGALPDPIHKLTFPNDGQITFGTGENGNVNWDLDDVKNYAKSLVKTNPLVARSVKPEAKKKKGFSDLFG